MTDTVIPGAGDVLMLVLVMLVALSSGSGKLLENQ